MRSAKIQQFVGSLIAVLSLFASSISACACSHHQPKTENNPPSCHEHSAETKAEQSQETSTEKFQPVVSESGCICLQLAPKAVAKAENIKVEKNLTSVSLETPIEINFVASNAAAKFDFSKPPYLSDSFYNLSPGRAPPIL